MKTKYVILVAGGKGLRMGTDIPKQFLPLYGKPVLMHTMDAFYSYDPNIRILLVLPEEQFFYWKELCEKFEYTIQHQVVAGGETRFHSVRNGLQFVTDDSLIAIHDGVRPLVSRDVITRCFEAAEREGAVFPVVPVVDTLRKKTESGTVMVNREDYCLVQTPQVFQSDIIKQAYQQAYSDCFTDDISVVENNGSYKVVTVEGSRDNIKITTSADLLIAEGLLKKL